MKKRKAIVVVLLISCSVSFLSPQEVVGAKGQSSGGGQTLRQKLVATLTVSDLINKALGEPDAASITQEFGSFTNIYNAYAGQAFLAFDVVNTALASPIGDEHIASRFKTGFAPALIAVKLVIDLINAPDMAAITQALNEATLAGTTEALPHVAKLFGFQTWLMLPAALIALSVTEIIALPGRYEQVYYEIYSDHYSNEFVRSARGRKNLARMLSDDSFIRYMTDPANPGLQSALRSRATDPDTTGFGRSMMQRMPSEELMQKCMKKFLNEYRDALITEWKKANKSKMEQEKAELEQNIRSQIASFIAALEGIKISLTGKIVDESGQAVRGSLAVAKTGWGYRIYSIPDKISILDLTSSGISGKVQSPGYKEKNVSGSISSEGVDLGTVRLERSGSAIEMKVTTKGSSKPITNATVVTPVGTIGANARGVYVFTLPPGDHQIGIGHPNYQTTIKQISSTSGTRKIDTALEPVSQDLGSVVSDDEPPPVYCPPVPDEVLGAISSAFSSYISGGKPYSDYAAAAIKAKRKIRSTEILAEKWLKATWDRSDGSKDRKYYKEQWLPAFKALKAKVDTEINKNDQEIREKLKPIQAKLAGIINQLKAMYKVIESNYSRLRTQRAFKSLLYYPNDPSVAQVRDMLRVGYTMWPGTKEALERAPSSEDLKFILLGDLYWHVKNLEPMIPGFDAEKKRIREDIAILEKAKQAMSSKKISQLIEEYNQVFNRNNKLLSYSAGAIDNWWSAGVVIQDVSSTYLNNLSAIEKKINKLKPVVIKVELLPDLFEQSISNLSRDQAKVSSVYSQLNAALGSLMSKCQRDVAEFKSMFGDLQKLKKKSDALVKQLFSARNSYKDTLQKLRRDFYQAEENVMRNSGGVGPMIQAQQAYENTVKGAAAKFKNIHSELERLFEEADDLDVKAKSLIPEKLRENLEQMARGYYPELKDLVISNNTYWELRNGFGDITSNLNRYMQRSYSFYMSFWEASSGFEERIAKFQRANQEFRPRISSMTDRLKKVEQAIGANDQSFLNQYFASQEPQSLSQDYNKLTNEFKATFGKVIIGFKPWYKVPYETNLAYQELEELAPRVLNYQQSYQQGLSIKPEIEMVKLQNIDASTLDEEKVFYPRDLRRGKIEIKGQVREGFTLQAVQVSLDGGGSWTKAKMKGKTPWIYTFRPNPGQSYKLQVKAIDKKGRESDPRDWQASFRYVAQDLKEQARKTLEEIQSAYIQENFRRFMKYIDEDEYIGDISALEDGIEANFENYSSINLELRVGRVSVSADKIEVGVSWEKTQMPKSSISEEHFRGRASFILNKTDPPKISDIRGDQFYVCAAGTGTGTGAGTGTGTGAGTGTGTGTGGGARRPSANLTRGKATIPNFQGYDFQSQAVVAAGSGDVKLCLLFGGTVAELDTTTLRIADMRGEALDDIAVAPDSGYRDAGHASVGDTYVLKTKAGKYVKLEVTNVNPTSASINYVLNTDGTKILK